MTTFEKWLAYLVQPDDLWNTAILARAGTRERIETMRAEQAARRVLEHSDNSGACH